VLDLFLILSYEKYEVQQPLAICSWISNINRFPFVSSSLTAVFGFMYPRFSICVNSEKPVALRQAILAIILIVISAVVIITNCNYQ
jgi:hypothetical protein